MLKSSEVTVLFDPRMGVSLDLILGALDRWLTTAPDWSRTKLARCPEKMSALLGRTNRKPGELEALVIQVLVQVGPPSDLPLLLRALSQICILIPGPDNQPARMNYFDSLPHRIFLDRFQLLLALMNPVQGGPTSIRLLQCVASQGSTSISLCGLWTPIIPIQVLPHTLPTCGRFLVDPHQWEEEQLQVWRRTISFSGYQEMLNKCDKLYAGSLLRLGLNLRPLEIDIQVLSLCNIDLLVQELAEEAPTTVCLWEELPTLIAPQSQSGIVPSLASMAHAVLARGRLLEVRKIERGLGLRLTPQEWKLHDLIMVQELFFKHATETAAIAGSLALVSATVGGQDRANTTKSIDVPFGHEDYVFGRLECTPGVFTGGQRYGEHVFALRLDLIGSQLCISLHDQGIPFDIETTHQTEIKGSVRTMKFTHKEAKEWEQHYHPSGKVLKRSFLREIFAGQFGCRLGLALSLIRELRAFGDEERALTWCLSQISMDPTGAALGHIIKSFFRPEVRVPCVVNLCSTAFVLAQSDENSVTLRPPRLRPVRILSTEQLIEAACIEYRLVVETTVACLGKGQFQKFINDLCLLCTMVSRGQSVDPAAVKKVVEQQKGKVNKFVPGGVDAFTRFLCVLLSRIAAFRNRNNL